MCINCATNGSALAEPQCDEAVPSLDEALSGLDEAGEELVRALESALIEKALSRVETREDSLERRIAALEKKVQEAVRPPAPADVSPSKEGEEHIIDACIKELASALVSACEERGFRLESFVFKPLKGGESKS